MSQVDALLTLSASDSDDSSDAEVDLEMTAQRILGTSSSPAPPAAATPSPVPASANTPAAQSLPDGATPQGPAGGLAQKLLSPSTPGEAISPARTASSSSVTPSSLSSSSSSPSSSSSASHRSTIRNLLPLLIKNAGGKDTERGRKITQLIKGIKDRLSADREAGRPQSFDWKGFMQTITAVVGKEMMAKCFREHQSNTHRREQKLAIHVARLVAEAVKRPMPAHNTPEFYGMVTMAWAGVEMWRHASAQERESPPNELHFAPLMQICRLLHEQDSAATVRQDEYLAKIKSVKPGPGLASYEAEKRKKTAAPLRRHVAGAIVPFADRDKSVVAGPRGYERRTQQYTDQDLRMLRRPRGVHTRKPWSAAVASDEALSFHRQFVQQQLTTACAQHHLSKPSDATQELVSLALHELMRGMLRSLSTAAEHRSRRQAGAEADNHTYNPRKRKRAPHGDAADTNGSASDSANGLGPTIRRADVVPLLLARQHACVNTHTMRNSRKGMNMNAPVCGK